MLLGPGGSCVSPRDSWPHFFPINMHFEAQSPGNLYGILNIQFQMLLSSPKLGCHLHFFTSSPSPHLSSPTKSWQFCVQNMHPGTSLVVQWLGVYTATAGATDLIPGLGTKIPLQVAFCFTFHCYFVTFIHLSVCLSTFISVPHSFLWICGQKKKKHPIGSLYPTSTTSTWFKDTTLPQGQWIWHPNGPPTASVNSLKHKLNPPWSALFSCCYSSYPLFFDS